MKPLTILHTSDWHLGQMLYRRRRDEEFAAFFDWLLALMREREVAALVVAGDVFDSATPPLPAQAMYYAFLGRVAKLGVRHVVIVGGNHDSPAFLAAPRELLRHFHIHVRGAASARPEEDVIACHDPQGRLELIVCAVPYLREKELRQAFPGESEADKRKRLLEGLRRHYAQAVAAALAVARQGDARPPVLATGHLFVAGAQAREEDGSRPVYVGALEQAPLDIFPPELDYVALGHLHSPQKAGGADTRRYCGSPLPMGFDEATRQHGVLLVRFDGAGAEPAIEFVPTPPFRRLLRLQGTSEAILNGLAALAATQEAGAVKEAEDGAPKPGAGAQEGPEATASQAQTKAGNGSARMDGNGPDMRPSVGQEESTGLEDIWVEIRHEGGGSLAELREQAQELCAGKGIDILCVRSAPAIFRAVAEAAPLRALEEWTPEEMFRRRLAVEHLDPAAQEEALALFRELHAAMLEEEAQGGEDADSGDQA